MEHISQHLVPITEPENKELLRQERKGLESGGAKLETQFLKSLKTPQIVQRPVQDLVAVLRKVMMKVGLRNQNFPSEIETNILIEHIVNYYGNHTHEEILLAFDLASTGQLELDKDGVNHFENFSCAYVSKIMTAYRAWAAKKYKESVKDVVPKSDLNDITMQDMWNLQLGGVWTGKLKPEHVYPSIYEWLEEKGVIKELGVKKSEYLKKAVDWFIEDLTRKNIENPSHTLRKQIEDFQRMKQYNIVEALYTGTVTTMAKKIIVYEIMKTKANETHESKV